MFKQEILWAFRRIRNSPSTAIPFLFESIVFYVFSLIVVDYFYALILGESSGMLWNIVMIAVNLLVLFLVVSFAEACGLGYVYGKIKGEKKGMFFYGNQLWWRMVGMTFVSLFACFVALLPAGILIYLFLYSNFAGIVFYVSIAYAACVLAFLSFGLKFSKFMMVSEDLSVLESIKKSFQLFFSEPKNVIYPMLVSIAMNIPVYLVYRYFVPLGIILMALISQDWNANFFFAVYDRIKHGGRGKVHDRGERSGKKAS